MILGYECYSNLGAVPASIDVAVIATPLEESSRYRIGSRKDDIDALTGTIQRVSQLVTDIPAIEELDINPLVALPDGVYAIDLGVTVDTDELSNR